MKFRERMKGRRKKNTLAQLMTKTKERQTKVTSQAKHKLHTEISKKAPPEQMQDPPEHVDANFQILAHLTSSEFSLSSPLLPLVDNV
jgi:hypothetical protein